MIEASPFFLALGVAIPTPGGIGGFQYFMSLALIHSFSRYMPTLDPYSQAAGVSNCVYIASMLPVFVIGLMLMNREGLSWRSLGGANQAMGKTVS